MRYLGNIHVVYLRTISTISEDSPHWILKTTQIQKQNIMKLIDLFSSRQKRLMEGAFKLHEVLQCSPLRGRHWICGGALLGWAREGSLLKHDPDIDFHFWEEDRESFLKGSEMLKQSGFKPEFCWRNTDNHITEYVLSYRHVRFEFFEATKVNGNTRWTAYGSNARRAIDGVQLLCETPGQELGEFEFLGKKWLKPQDHIKYLVSARKPPF